MVELSGVGKVMVDGIDGDDARSVRMYRVFPASKISNRESEATATRISDAVG
jgi:hypothetical protein